MASIFPTNPYTGETFSLGSTTYVWNGVAWAKTANKIVSDLTATTVTITTTTNSTSTSSGALTVNGGAGVGGNVNIGGSLNVSDTSYVGGAQIITTATIGQYASANVGANTSTTSTFLITNTTPSTSTTTGALVVAGGVGIGGDVYIGGSIHSENLRLVDAIFDSSQVLVNTTATVVVDSYDLAVFRSAKYVVQIDSGTGSGAEFQVIEILVLVDNNQTVYATEYGQLTTHGALGEFAADVQGDNMVRLYFTSFAATNKVISAVRTALVV